MKNLIILLFLVAIGLTGCKKVKLDSVAFPSERLDNYQFENYDAGDAAVPDIYAIDPSMRTLISMTSTDKTTGDEYTIYGVYIGNLATMATDTVILYCHGQSLHMDAYWPRVSLLSHITNAHQYGVFMMDYRGYGMSEGSSTEQGLYEDVDASIDWLIANGVQPENTYYYGFSLGCIPVIDRAAYRADFKPAKVMIEAPLASVENLTQSSLVLNVDPSYITTLEFENAEKIKDVLAPLLWWHGVEDDYIAIDNGELIYKNHSGIKYAERVEGANHNNVPKTYGYDKYLNRLSAFIQE